MVSSSRRRTPQVTGGNHGDWSWRRKGVVFLPGSSVTGDFTWIRVLVMMSVFYGICVGRVGSQLTGSTATCDLPDGTDVVVPGISDDPCISCLCQDGEVQCMQETCPSLQGCHMILYDKPQSQCCDVCKGCDYKGSHQGSGTSWVDRRKPCKRYSCLAGVVTSYKAVCHVPCKHPLVLKGQCCPVCEGCSLNGVRYKEGDTFPSFKDPCSTCTCQNGTIECTRRACPVLNCLEKYVTTTPGACCPHCEKTRKYFDPKKSLCLFRSEIFLNGSQTDPNLDPCYSCRCLNGTMICQRKVCTPLHCDRDDVIYDPSMCCPKCKEKMKHCRFRGKSHKHGATWWTDECTSCSCDNGTVRCHVQQCGNHVECPRGQRLSHVRGKCCPVCIESDAVCAVFGDPHYRTFDGRIYNFQGTCRFILAEDCFNKNFSVRVHNDARLTNDFAWTKSVSVVLPADNLRVALKQNLKIKVNGKTTSPPFVTNNVAIVKGGQTLTLKTTFGLKVIWDGDSYLEVSVPIIYKTKMCGLCGNYNGIQADDFLGKDGALYFDANEFAETWRLGKSKRCGRRKNKSLKSNQGLCGGNKRKLARAQGECSILLGQPFTTCRKILDVEPYYRSCMVDECDCPRHKRCSCEAITAFSRQCGRDGINVMWRTPSVCGAPSCPKGATFNVCASACPRTCDNWMLPAFCDKPCVPACQCPPNKVLRGNRCITPDRCKRRKISKISNVKNLLDFS